LEINIVIISAAFAAALCLAVGVIMLLNNNNIFHKWLPHAVLFLGFLNIIDLLNLVINHTYFYDVFKIYYSDVQNSILRLVSLTTPAFIPVLFFGNFKLKFKYFNILLVSGILFLSIIILFLVLDTTYHKPAFVVYYYTCFMFFLYLIITNKTFLKENNAYIFLLVIFYSFIFVYVFSILYLLYTDTFFSQVFSLLPGLDFDLPNTFIKFIFNMRLIIIPISFFLSPKLLFGSYYFESKSKLESSQYVKNHWSNTRFGKINKIDFKTFEELNGNLPELISKLIQIETQFIRNEVLYNNLEDISQLINEKTQSVEFIFKYHNSLTFSKYFIKIKMLRAAFLIEDGYLKNNNVTELSQLSGYNSRSAFFTKFKQVNGFSPTKY
jgi:AraC-like DNA-binding protein